ncbi:MAG TPA: peptide ABC transporter substrate-binding protein [Thermomicrobiaceae bacterium]|nr:peptide ABC transporter substrate-binding protein [Thermomicrobiaceae bacterium]
MGHPFETIDVPGARRTSAPVLVVEEVALIEHPSSPASLARAAAAGNLTRRQVLARAAALGLSAPAIASLLAACGGGGPSAAATVAPTTGTGTGATSTAAASGGGATPAATTAASTASATPATAAGSRGSSGNLKVVMAQATTILNPALASGYKDWYAAQFVLEPLADFDTNGNLYAVLAAEVPSQANGGLSSDGTSVTWKLKPNVVWSDGQPFTASDVKFTYDYTVNPATGATTAGSYTGIASVDVVDPLTVKVTFKKPTPGWYLAYCGYTGLILPQHLLSSYVGSAAKNAPFNLKPTGTGPFVVTDFKPGDTMNLAANDKYRDPNLPHFATVNVAGGVDALSAARAVIQTGEADYAWGAVIPAAVYNSMVNGTTGHLITSPPAAGVERIAVNMTDPNTTVDGQKSHLGTPHPFQSIPAVRQAYSLLVDRETMASKLYGPAGQTTANVLVSPSRFNSKNTSWKYDIAKAEQLLDGAGWTKGSGGVRSKNGVTMNVTYATTVNTLRQQEQELVKSSFQQAGINVSLKTIDASVFFSSGASNPDTYEHFYWDLEMFTNGPTDPFPIAFMQGWYGATSNIAQRENSWSGVNIERWQNSQYDALYEQALTEMDPSKQPSLFIGMNDLIINNWVRIPEVWRNGVSGQSRKLQNVNVQTWASSELWNLANWTKTT